MKTSGTLWIDWITHQLPRRTAENDPPTRIAVVGIGAELNGDDAAGVAAVRLLRPLFAQVEHMLVVEAGPIAENSTGSLRRFRPDVVILLDAAWFGGEPGEIRGLDWHEADGFSASTHTVPMSVFANYLESEFGCQVLLLAVQAASVEFGDPVSLPVRRAVRRLVRGLHTLLFSITE